MYTCVYVYIVISIYPMTCVASRCDRGTLPTGTRVGPTKHQETTEFSMGNSCEPVQMSDLYTMIHVVSSCHPGNMTKHCQSSSGIMPGPWKAVVSTTNISTRILRRQGTSLGIVQLETCWEPTPDLPSYSWLPLTITNNSYSSLSTMKTHDC